MTAAISSGSAGRVGTTREPAASTATPALGQADFLRLMTAQMTSQDPFKPMDSTQMVAQMAQFSQVAGIAEMNLSLKDISARLGGTDGSARVADWIGRSALVDSDVIAPLDDGSLRGEIMIGSAADNVTLVLADAQGREVRRVDLGAAERGPLAFALAGEGDGQPMSIRAITTTGSTSSPAATRVWTVIGAVDAPSGPSPELQTPLGAISPSSVRRLA